jgi:hypothetical protein
MALSRPIPEPSGTVVEITRVRRYTIARHRETQPYINYPNYDTIPGDDSKDS